MCFLFLAGPAWSGRFVNLAETATFAPSEGEIVQATAFSTCSGQPCRSDVLEFQTGLEYGLLPRFQVGLALPSLAVNLSERENSTAFGGTAFWGLYNFIDPDQREWGLSGAILFAENSGDRSGELALLVEKPLDRWLLVYNGLAGRSWYRWEEAGATEFMAHSLGASYQASRSLFVGLEGDIYLEREPGWRTSGRYLGPNVSVDAGRMWITASAQWAVATGGIIPAQVFQMQVGLPF